MNCFLGLGTGPLLLSWWWCRCRELAMGSSAAVAVTGVSSSTSVVMQTEAAAAAAVNEADSLLALGDRPDSSLENAGRRPPLLAVTTMAAVAVAFDALPLPSKDVGLSS